MCAIFQTHLVGLYGEDMANIPYNKKSELITLI